MTSPIVTEIRQALEPVVRDTFADDAAHRSAGARAALWVRPTRRPADA
jgi:hypothetical protein